MGFYQKLKGDVFNIATGSSVNLFKLIQDLKKELNIKTAQVLFRPSRKGDILYSKADCSKYLKFKGKFDTFDL